MARDFGGKPQPGVKIPATRRAGGGPAGGEADNAALENALRLIRGSDIGGGALTSLPGLTGGNKILPGESAGIPTKMGQKASGMPQGLRDILAAAAMGGAGGGIGSALGGAGGGYLGTGLAVLMQILKDKGKKKTASPSAAPTSTPGKKGGGPVKGKTKNQKMPQIPKGTPRGPASTYKTGGMMKGGKAKGCK